MQLATPPTDGRRDFASSKLSDMGEGANSIIELLGLPLCALLMLTGRGRFFGLFSIGDMGALAIESPAGKEGLPWAHSTIGARMVPNAEIWLAEA